MNLVNKCMKLTKKTLKLKTKNVTFKFPKGLELLEDQLFKLMKENGGVGLAANQVGLRDRVFVMNTDNKKQAFWNPAIIEASQEMEKYSEGCLSYPNEYCELDRPNWVVILYHDNTGKIFQERLIGLEARVAQHEIDHLDGITMFDRKEDNK